MNEKLKHRLYVLAVLLMAVVSVWSLVFSFVSDGEAKVYFLDVGQGDAIFIETENKTQILIDGGPDNSVLSELSGVMPFYDKSIDFIVISHPQKDHIFGLVEVLKRYEVKNLVFSSIESENRAYEEIKKLAEDRGVNKIEAFAGKRISFSEFSNMDIVYPFSDMSGREVDNPNDLSLSLIFDFLGKKFLFAGDAELKQELDMVNSGVNLDVDVLKVNHHGSKTSSSELFLESTSPEIAVISVGEKNSYGHPNEMVLKRLEDATEVLRTDQMGRIKITSNGEWVRYKTEN